jgi:hypothetical protein
MPNNTCGTGKYKILEALLKRHNEDVMFSDGADDTTKLTEEEWDALEDIYRVVQGEL